MLISCAEYMAPTTPPQQRHATNFVARNTRYVRRTLEVSQMKLADLIGVKQPTVSAYERGEDNPSDEVVAKLAELVGTTIAKFRYTDLAKPEEERPKIAVAGYIEVGETITPATEAMDSIDLVEIPPNVDQTGLKVLKIRPGVLPPPFGGAWYAWYRRANTEPGVPAECIGQLCIVKLANGQMTMKAIARDNGDGSFMLQGVGGAVQDNVAVEWAAMIESFTRY